MPTPVTRQDFPEIRWRGHWIWVPEEPIAPSGFMSDSPVSLALDFRTPDCSCKEELTICPPTSSQPSCAAST